MGVLVLMWRMIQAAVGRGIGWRRYAGITQGDEGLIPTLL